MTAVTDIGAWLRGLGLGEYEAAVRADRVDAAVPPELTAEDLREKGVAAVGDRRRLLAAANGAFGTGMPA